MNFRKLITYLTMGTAAAMPLAVAQNPTILQGNYISNVFGNSNFVLNPNALTNVANVTNATRSTTTPLVATSEFTLSLASGANATWTLRAFDGGMKGQNCEARFTYRGFATATTKAEIVQNSLVVASLTLTPTTDPRIASINFPCGDLANLTTFRIAQTTANMTGTNEIGGIYVGLATNMANVAQAEFVGSFTLGSAPSCNFQTTSTGYVAFTTSNANCPAPQVEQNVAAVVGQEKTPQFTVNAQKPGRYFIVATAFIQKNGTTGGSMSMVLSDGTDQSAPTSINVLSSATGANVVNQHTFNWTTSGTRTIQMKFATFSASNTLVVANDATSHNYIRADIYRFPSSSELVVTPERQNVWGGVVYTAENQSLFVGSAEPTAYSSYNNSTWNKPAKLVGKAQVTTTNSGNDLGFSIPNMPVGAYKLQITGLLNAEPTSVTGVFASCNYKIVETTTSTDVAKQAYEALQTASGGTRNFVNSFQGIFNNTSVATRNFRLEAKKYTDTDASNNSGCQAYSITNPASIESNIAFTIVPLDQPSNSALYVEGPVKASATGAAIPSGYLGKAEFGGGNGSTTASPANVYTISNVTPGVYLVRGYSAAQATGARTATYAGYGCTVTSNASLSLNWFDFLNFPQTHFGATGGTFTGFALSNNYANSSASIMQIINVTSTSTYYVRCAIDANGSGVLVVAGAEFIRLN